MRTKVSDWRKVRHGPRDYNRLGKIEFWQPRSPGHPLGGINRVWIGRNFTIRIRPFTRSDGSEITPELAGRWRDVDEAEMIKHGYRMIADPPTYGFVVADPEGARWRVGSLRPDGTRVLRNLPKGKMPALAPKALTLAEIAAGHDTVETNKERLEREGREHAEQIEEREQAEAAAKARHRSAAEMRGPKDRLFA